MKVDLEPFEMMSLEEYHKEWPPSGSEEEDRQRAAHQQLRKEF